LALGSFQRRSNNEILHPLLQPDPDLGRSRRHVEAVISVLLPSSATPHYDDPDTLSTRDFLADSSPQHLRTCAEA
jgi:hypothetical protein